MCSRRGLLIGLPVCGLMLPRAARATVGGPQTLQVLGYAAGDGKLYMLRNYEDSSDSNPDLVYMPLRGPHAGREITAVSWYVDDDGTDEFSERLFARIAKLEKRLTKTSPAGRVRLRAKAAGRVSWTASYDPSLSATGRRYAVELTSGSGTHQGSAVLDSFGCLNLGSGCRRTRVVEAHRLRRVDRIVAIVESLALPEEGGYSAHEAVLMSPVVATEG